MTCYPTGNLDNVDRNLNTQFSQRELGELPWQHHIEYSTTVSTDHDNNDMQRPFNQPFTQNKLPTLRGTSLNEISRFVHSLDQTDIAFYAAKGIYLVPNFITHPMAASLEDALYNDDLPENDAGQFKLLYTRTQNATDLAGVGSRTKAEGRESNRVLESVRQA